jgi:hypothetical protein
MIAGAARDSFCARRNVSSEHGTCAATGFPLAMITGFMAVIFACFDELHKSDCKLHQEHTKLKKQCLVHMSLCFSPI